MKKLNIGIAFAGGGAKGAYSAGLCKALKQSDNLKIKAISGTSVGGLNAFILASQKFKEGENIWFNIDFKNTYPLKRNKIASMILGPLIVISHVFFEFILRTLPIKVYDNFRIKIKKWFDLYMILIVLLTIGLIIIKQFSVWMLLTSILIGLYYVSTKRAKDDELLAIQRVISLHILANFTVFITSIIEVVNGKFTVDLLLSGISLFIILCLTIPGLVFPNSTLMNNKPLRDTISNITKGSVLNIPTYITTALRVTLFDPLDIRIVNTKGGRKEVNNTTYIPIYSNLQNYNDEEMADILSATAALPIGIVNKVKFRGRDLVDGGIIDNLPIFPLLEYENCDAVIAIALDKIDQRELQVTYNLNDYHLRTLSMNMKYLKDFDRKKKMRFIKDIEVYSRRKTDTQKIYCIEPKFALGGWKDGTLNFNSDYAKEIYEKGYQHGLELVEDIKANRFEEKYLKNIPLGIEIHSFRYMEPIEMTNMIKF